MAGFDALLDRLLEGPYPTPIDEQIRELQMATDSLSVNWFAQRLAFVTVQYLGLVGWYDYFNSGARDDAVERALREPGSRKASMGHWCGLLKAVANVRCGFRLLDIGYSSRTEATALPGISTFVRGWEHVRSEIGKRANPERILHGVEEHLTRQPARKVSIEDLIAGLLEYRNSIAHALENDFPAHDRRLTEQINAWMVPALGELLQHEQVKAILCGHAWTTPTPARDVCRRVPGDLWEAPAIWQAGRATRVRIQSEKDFEVGDYLVRMEGRIGRLLFKFSFSNAWPTDPKQTAPAPLPEVAGRPLAAHAREIFSAVVDMARLDGLTAAERERLASIRDLLGLDEASADEVIGRDEPRAVENAAATARASEVAPPATADGPASDDDAFARRTLGLLDSLLASVLPGHTKHIASVGTLEEIRVGKGGLSVALSATTVVSAWFWRDGDELCAAAGYYGAAGEADSDFAAGLSRLEAVQGEIWPGWRFKRATWRTGGFEGFHGIHAPLPAPETMALRIARVLARIASIVSPNALGVGEPVAQTAALLGTSVDTLLAELVRLETRALAEPWETVLASLGRRPQPYANRDTSGKTMWGRIGVNLLRRWAPGVFAGVMVDGRDHRVLSSQPRLGVDAVVILSTFVRKNSGFDHAVFTSSPAFLELRTRLTRASAPWDFHDHLAVPKPNLWHPIHLRRPLLELWEGAETEDERYVRWLEAVRGGIRLLLEGGELRSLVEQPFTPTGSDDESHEPHETRAIEGEAPAEVPAWREWPGFDLDAIGPRNLIAVRVGDSAPRRVAGWSHVLLATVEHLQRKGVTLPFDKPLVHGGGRVLRTQKPTTYCREVPGGWLDMAVTKQQALDRSKSLLATVGRDGDAIRVLIDQPGAWREWTGKIESGRSPVAWRIAGTAPFPVTTFVGVLVSVCGFLVEGGHELPFDESFYGGTPWLSRDRVTFKWNVQPVPGGFLNTQIDARQACTRAQKLLKDALGEKTRLELWIE